MASSWQMFELMADEVSTSSWQMFELMADEVSTSSWQMFKLMADEVSRKMLMEGFKLLNETYL